MTSMLNAEERIMSLVASMPPQAAETVSKAIRGRAWSNGAKGIEGLLLGVKYRFSVGLARSSTVDDPLTREEDVARLLNYLANAIERALTKGLVTYEGKLIGLTALPGGHTARLYEKKTIDFIAVEMEDAEVSDVEKAAELMGGKVVQHLNADWAFEVSPFDGIRIRIALWRGEEDIPSGAVVLVGEEVKELDIPIEELLTIMEMTINRFVLFYRKVSGRQHKMFHSLYF